MNVDLTAAAKLGYRRDVRRRRSLWRWRLSVFLSAGCALVPAGLGATVWGQSPSASADSPGASGYHAPCVDVYHAFNGPDGKTPMRNGYQSPGFADYNQRGQDEIAIEIMRTGFAPLGPPTERP